MNSAIHSATLINLLTTNSITSKIKDPYKTRGSLFGLFGSEDSNAPDAISEWNNTELLIDHNSVGTINFIDPIGD